MLEFGTSEGRWYAVRASLPPEVLLDEIHNIVNLEDVPGVGRFDLQAEAARESPVLTEENWALMCIAVAEKDMTLFGPLFAQLAPSAGLKAFGKIQVVGAT